MHVSNEGHETGKEGNMEKLEITFNVEGGKTTKLIIREPKENLTKATVASACEKIFPVLTNSLGNKVTGFEKAQKVTTEIEELE